MLCSILFCYGSVITYVQYRSVLFGHVQVMRGNYEYIGADNELYRVNWYADETGYHAEAEHLPRDERFHVHVIWGKVLQINLHCTDWSGIRVAIQ